MALLAHTAGARRDLSLDRRVRSAPRRRASTYRHHRSRACCPSRDQAGLGRGDVPPHPVVSWTTRDGRECVYASMFGRGSITPRFGVGSTVTVLYDETKPSRFELRGWDSTSVFTVFTVVGTALTAGTLSVLFVLLVFKGRLAP
ncbi:DUF3592 domain-containing protein [Streptomyces sp. NPDC048416]|uniref:DUF3592 domain-containing protein n=1 Tax=Streptomyces sp. NPDC048416 TaxID=3365546 RepID=UPI003723408A